MVEKPLIELDITVDVEDDKLTGINFTGHLDARAGVEHIKIVALRLSETLEQIINKYS